MVCGSLSHQLCGVDNPDILDIPHSAGDLDGLSAPPSLSLSSGTGTPTQGSVQNGHGFAGDSPLDGIHLSGGLSPHQDEMGMVFSLEQELDRLVIPVRDVMVEKVVLIFKMS